MAEASSSAEARSQYHHFIPRFILRNFSHPGQPNNASKQSRNRGKGKKKAPRPPAPEDMVNGISLEGVEAEVVETPVAKTFGMTDMYRDFENSAKQHHIETQLSVLETAAGRIISTIRKDFEAGKDEVWITRGQRDILRKFLFIMKYRGSTAHRRFYHQEVDDYNENDKDSMSKYMEGKGFKKPIDVWLDNIKGMLELKMDTAGEWMKKLEERIYPDDAKLFVNNTQQFYLAICTPSEEDDEFLLTQNAYSMHEGPVSFKLDPLTRETTMLVYTEFHLFAPIAPRLIFVLRSHILPSPLEDADPGVKQLREAMFEANMVQHNFPRDLGSMLKDLPISKATNSYSKAVNGKLVYVDGGPKGAVDKYCFRFFPIETEHVSKINSLMLEESYKISTIVFRSKASARKTLEKYLNDLDTFHENDPVGDLGRTECIKKLRQATKLLGGSPKLLPSPISPNLPGIDFQGIAPDKVFELFENNGEATALYKELSGKISLDREDFNEARGLLYKRIKLDSNSRHVAPDKREKARNNFINVYSDYPIQVIWIYLKRIRLMKLGGTIIGPFDAIWDSELPADELEGIEDDVARVRSSFRKKDLPRIMHYASNNAFLLQTPDYGLVGELTLDDDGMRRLQKEKSLALGPQGNICDCGISEVEKAARTIKQLVITEQLHKKSQSPFDGIFTEHEKVELTTRELVKQQHAHASTLGLPIDDQRELEMFILDVVYPAFGSRRCMEAEENQERSEGGRCVVQ